MIVAYVAGKIYPQPIELPICWWDEVWSTFFDSKLDSKHWLKLSFNLNCSYSIYSASCPIISMSVAAIALTFLFDSNDLVISVLRVQISFVSSFIGWFTRLISHGSFSGNSVSCVLSDCSHEFLKPIWYIYVRSVISIIRIIAQSVLISRWHDFFLAVEKSHFKRLSYFRSSRYLSISISLTQCAKKLLTVIKFASILFASTESFWILIGKQIWTYSNLFIGLLVT